MTDEHPKYPPFRMTSGMFHAALEAFIATHNGYKAPEQLVEAMLTAAYLKACEENPVEETPTDGQ